MPAEPETGPAPRSDRRPAAADVGAAGIIAFGLLLRIRAYLFNRSLWIDEAELALNIVRRSLGGLMRPLDHSQAAPAGFLAAERGAVVAFGGGERALRLVPFLAGALVLLLTWRLARKYLAAP